MLRYNGRMGTSDLSIVATPWVVVASVPGSDGLVGLEYRGFAAAMVCTSTRIEQAGSDSLNQIKRTTTKKISARWISYLNKKFVVVPCV